MDIISLKKKLGITSFKERWPGLTDIIREGKEAERRALSGPTIADLCQAEEDQLIANIQRQTQRTRITIFDEDEKEQSHDT